MNLTLLGRFLGILNHGFHGCSRIGRNLPSSDPCHPWSILQRVSEVLTSSTIRSWLVLACLLTITLRSQAAEPSGAVLSNDEFFDPNRLLEVQITLSAEDFEKLRQQHRDLSAQFSQSRTEKAQALPKSYEWFKGEVTIGGVTLKNVGIRKRGLLGSDNSTRPSFNIDFDHFVKGQTFAGEARFTLHNNNQDPSQVQQALGYRVFAAAGVPAPRCNLAQVTVNGKSLGIYSHIEAVDERFLRRHFSNAKGNLYEATGSDFRPGWVNAFESKNHKTTNDRGDLEQVVRALDSKEGMIERVSQVVDVSAYLNFWATEVLIGHWDGFAGNQNNAFVYHDPKADKFHFIAWGADSTFGDSDVFVPFVPPVSVKANGYLARQLYNHPQTREKYRQRMRELLATVWKEQELLAEVDRMEVLVKDRITIPKPQFDAGLKKVREYIRTQRAAMESELAQPAKPWIYPMRPNRYNEFAGKLSASFSTVWSTNPVSMELTNFPPQHLGQLDLDFYSQRYSDKQARSRTGIHPRHPDFASVQVVAAVDGVTAPVTVSISVEKDVFLKGGTIPLDGRQAIGYLVTGVRGTKSFRVLSFLQNGKGSITLDRSGLKLGDEVSGHIETEVWARLWEDFDLKVLNAVSSAKVR
ncbi:MAG: hypothetical protein EXS31_02465 [Pedosphaera sp.]|nr:hypothetical protein [Pedosphaera sp.]